MATLTTKIVLRHDTAANWIKYNPILLAGEMGVETDTGLLKVGNGLSTWTALEYINNFENNSTATHYEGTAELLEDGTPETDEAVIARVLGETAAKLDDVFIVRRLIAAEKYSHTAYIFNGNAWAAMDGNYNANNIYFDEDFITTADIGVVKVNDNGSTTVAAEGKNLSAVLSSILAKREEPTVILPEVTISFTNSVKNVEVGTVIAPTYSAFLSTGSYSFGPATEIVAQSWSVTDGIETLTASSGTFKEVIIGDQENSIKSYSITATAAYNEGTIPVDNFGDEYALGRIAAGSASASTGTKITGHRSYFYGPLTTSSEEEPLTSDVIRSLTKGGAYNASKILTVNPGSVAAKRVVVAYPADTTRAGLKEVTLTSSMNMTITENYVQQMNIEVEGANGYQAIPYTVFVYEPGYLGTDEVHRIVLA